MAQNSNDRESNDLGKKHTSEDTQDLTSQGGRENASANRGGTTDMDQDALTVDRDNTTRRGSGITTKNTVAGSDFDGQLSGE